MKTVHIPHNSFLAILDRHFKRLGVKGVYVWQVYHNTITRKKEQGILIHTIDGHAALFDAKHKDSIGILGFVNGQEPIEGTVPLHTVLPKLNDVLALAYIVQGMYSGDFGEATIVEGKAHKEGKELRGVQLIHHCTVQEDDLESKPYEIQVIPRELLVTQ